MAGDASLDEIPFGASGGPVRFDGSPQILFCQLDKPR